MPQPPYSTLLLDIDDNIATITLNRPPANLIDKTLTLEYLSALDEADENPEVKAIILTGAGKGLSAGVDLNFLESFGADEMREFLELFYIGTLQRVRSLNKPIIASIHGYAREGACTLAFACDMIVAADTADFAYPGVPNLAGPPGMHVWFLQKLLGRMKAAELILTGEPIGAVEAERAGLITKVVPTDELKQRTLELASKLAQMSPLALKTTRDLMYKMEDMPFSEVPQTALNALASAFDTEDSKEARRAFLEKRKPVWSGK